MPPPVKLKYPAEPHYPRPQLEKHSGSAHAPQRRNPRESKKLKLSNLLTQNICSNFTRQMSTVQHITNMQTSNNTENSHHKLVLVTLFLVYLIYQHVKIEISCIERQLHIFISFIFCILSVHVSIHPFISGREAQSVYRASKARLLQRFHYQVLVQP